MGRFLGCGASSLQQEVAERGVSGLLPREGRCWLEKPSPYIEGACVCLCVMQFLFARQSCQLYRVLEVWSLFYLAQLVVSGTKQLLGKGLFSDCFLNVD